MSALPPTLGRIPSIDQQKGPVAARRHIPIQPLHIPTSPATSSSSADLAGAANIPTFAAAGSTSSPIIPIPFNADSSAVHSLPIDLGSVPMTYPRSAEQRMEQEGGVLVSAEEDLRVFEQPVAHSQSAVYSSSSDIQAATMQ